MPKVNSKAQIKQYFVKLAKFYETFSVGSRPFDLNLSAGSSGPGSAFI